MVALSHVGFRAAALLAYFFANLFFSSFIVQFLVVVSVLPPSRTPSS